MKPSVWILPVAFALGFGAWTANRAVRIRGHLQKIDDARKTPTRRSDSPDPLSEVPPGDIPLLIELWKKRAGFSGLDYGEQIAIKMLVRNWYEKEPDAALAWVAKMNCQKDRQILISEIVGMEAKREFGHAIELAKQYGKKELGGLSMPEEIQDKIGEFDASRMMEIMSAFPSDGLEDRGSHVIFKNGFDFAALAELIHKSREEKQSFNFYPANFIRGWTRVDPDAAWNWLSNDGRNDLRELPKTQEQLIFSELWPVKCIGCWR